MFESMPAVATQQEERLVRGWGGVQGLKDTCVRMIRADRNGFPPSSIKTLLRSTSQGLLFSGVVQTCTIAVTN
jgi:hypothetical protein